MAKYNNLVVQWYIKTPTAQDVVLSSAWEEVHFEDDLPHQKIQTLMMPLHLLQDMLHHLRLEN